VVRVFLPEPRLHPRFFTPDALDWRSTRYFANLPISVSLVSLSADSSAVIEATLLETENSRGWSFQFSVLDHSRRHKRAKFARNGRNSWPITRVRTWTSFVMVRVGQFEIADSRQRRAARPSRFEPRRNNCKPSRRGATPCWIGQSKIPGSRICNRNSRKKHQLRMRPESMQRSDSFAAAEQHFHGVLSRYCRLRRSTTTFSRRCCRVLAFPPLCGTSRVANSPLKTPTQIPAGDSSDSPRRQIRWRQTSDRWERSNPQLSRIPLGRTLPRIFPLPTDKASRAKNRSKWAIARGCSGKQFQTNVLLEEPRNAFWPDEFLSGREVVQCKPFRTPATPTCELR